MRVIMNKYTEEQLNEKYVLEMGSILEQPHYRKVGTAKHNKEALYSTEARYSENEFDLNSYHIMSDGVKSVKTLREILGRDGPPPIKGLPPINGLEPIKA